MTIDGRELPALPSAFGGVIKQNAVDSKPYWPPRIVPPKGAPNVLLIMTDDVGFGAPSTFGGVIPTPALDRVAQMGLRYTQFCSTALSSPTRAALITGCNHHSAGFGVISEMATGFPGYDSIISENCATIGRILKDHGYAIYPYVGNPNWNLTTAMADDAIAHMKMLNEVDPKKPFFVHYVPGGTHAPHHPTPEWIKKISDMHLFDKGWNDLRETIFANQKRLGVIPQNAKLTPWPKELLKDWNTLSADEKKLFIRQVEVYAAYLAYTDHEIGRVIQAVEDMGKLNDTLIIYISGDNGSSAEGSLNGTPNEVAQFNSVEVPVADQLKYFYDVWGSDKTYNHMAVGWTWAFDTPFKWTKQIASHFGGTRQGMCIAWPGHITDAGGIRHQFHHVIDVVPTILEICNIKQPETVDGIKQRPIEGVSMVYSFDKANANAPTKHKTQYFEMFGNRGIYHNGWYANTQPISPPWNLGATPNPDVMNSYKWELYDLTNDWTQENDLAASKSDKLKEMQQIFIKEANKYQVFPLDNSLATRMVTPRPSVTAGRNEFTYSGVLTGIPMGDAPSLIAASYTITAEVEVPEDGGEGMMATQGGRFGGWGFYLLKGKPVFVWNLLDLKRDRWEDVKALAPGKHTLFFDFKYDGLGFATLAFNNRSGLGQGGTGVLKVDGQEVVSKKMEHTIPVILQWDETFDIGADTGTPVDDHDYQVPFKFTGKLNKLTLKIERPQLTPEDEKRLKEDSQRSNRASE